MRLCLFTDVLALVGLGEVADGDAFYMLPMYLPVDNQCAALEQKMAHSKKTLFFYLAVFTAVLLQLFCLAAADAPKYDNLALGIPGKCDTLIDRPGYALGYIEYHEQAAFVIYKLTAREALTKEAQRTNRFRSDPEIPTGSATTADYHRSGYDRGHLAPAADMAFSVQTMADSFFMSNMSPQKPAFNRGIWKRLEEQVRQIAIREKAIYVVTGPILPKKKTVTIGANQVTVPTHYYKVIFDLTPPRKMIGFILPNEGSDRPLEDFAVTVDVVEKATGLNFFSALPQAVQKKLESKITVSEWKF